MDLRRVLRFFAFALLWFDLAAAGSECNRKAGELISNNRFYSALLEINEDLAELFCVHCGVDMINAKEALEDLQLYAPVEKSGINTAIDSRSTLLATEDTHERFRALNPEVNRFLDCLRQKNLMPLKECSSKNWYTKYLEFFFSRTDAPRRRHLLQSSAPVPASSPASGSPTSSPSPSPVPSPPDPPSTAPSPVIPFFPNLSGSTSQPTAGGQSSASPGSSTSVQPNKQSSSRKAVVVAVIVTATVSFFLAALFFFCYLCKRSGGRRNDERPLLSLSLSNYSIGSTQKLFSPGNSTYEEKRDNQSFNTNLNSNKMAPSLDAIYYGESDIFSVPKSDTQSVAAVKTSTWDSVPISHSSLKPPPGRLSNPPGVPLLKPPPGRQDILPAKQPPLDNGTPPRPPPPPLGSASSLKVSSGTPRPPPSGPPPPPIPSGIKTGPRPPPPPRSGAPPPRPPPMGSKPLRPSPLAPNPAGEGSETDGSKTKLKPFFWDKVLANPDHSMVWHQIRSGSFQFNEEMIETLFGYGPPERNKNEAKKKSSSQDPATQYVQIIDSKKAQNLSILLRALNVTTEEVCDALQEGHELPSELLQTLFKMAPTSEEEVKLGLFNGDLSRLGPADRFLKVLVDIPFAFKRMESLLFMGTFQEEVSTIQDSFTTLEAACTQLKKSRLFLKLLEAVLKTGNRMNVGTFRGGAQAFKLDTLLKLSDVKGTDGKTTLLHFVVLEIIRSEGVKAARTARESQSISTSGFDDPSLDSEEHYRSLGLQAVSGLSSELENVKKAAVLDADSLKGAVAKLGHQMVKARDLFNTDMMKVDEQNGFRIALKSFVQNAEVDIMSLLEEEKRIVALVKSTSDYFQGNAGKDEGLRLFVIVRDFLIILDKVCKEVKNTPRKPPNRKPNGKGSTIKPSSDPGSLSDPRQRLFPAITDRRMDSSSSDDDAP